MTILRGRNLKRKGPVFLRKPGHSAPTVVKFIETYQENQTVASSISTFNIAVGAYFFKEKNMSIDNFQTTLTILLDTPFKLAGSVTYITV